MSTPQRVYAMYKSLRRNKRGLYTDQSGSYQMNILSQVAQELGMTMQQVKNNYITGYADKHGITVEESQELFNHKKDNRAITHETTGCCNDNGLKAYACSKNYS